MKKETVSRLACRCRRRFCGNWMMSGEKGYDNRSLAIADMIRDRLVEHRQKFGNEDIAAPSRSSTTITSRTCRRRSPKSSTIITT